jgi:hypothetical protein
MRRRGTGRFALAFAVVVLLGQLGFSTVMAVGTRGGGAGVIAALVVAGFALALVFTAIYDGPRSLAGLVRGSPPRGLPPGPSG